MLEECKNKNKAKQNIFQWKTGTMQPSKKLNPSRTATMSLIVPWTYCHSFPAQTRFLYQCLYLQYLLGSSSLILTSLSTDIYYFSTKGRFELHKAIGHFLVAVAKYYRYFWGLDSWPFKLIASLWMKIASSTSFCPERVKESM